MCGILGMVGHEHDIDRHQLLEILAHRGPDGEGEWQSIDQLVWLGHRRLSIIDPEGGKQPLSNEDGTIWITFNGCIYNYLEISQVLRRKGHQFRTYSDTEVVVHAYEEYGEECLKYFVGMFAFAIWDDRKRILFCARDRLGIKPFYYGSGVGRFAFASEIKALLTKGLFEKQVNWEALQDYLLFQTVLGEDTLFRGIKKLPPGHYLIVNDLGQIVQTRQYWDLSFDMDLDHTEEYFVDRLRMLIEDAVKIRLRSDVPLGAHLSGGLDSTTIVCLATALNAMGDRLKTFTGAFREGEAFDETRYARLAADHCGAESLEVFCSAEDFTRVLPKIIYFMDEPSAGPGIFPQYLVSRLASEHVKVVLGGQGGDEIFAGYARYLVGYLEECLKGAIEETDKRASYAATLSSIIPSLPMLQQYVPMLQHFWSKGLFAPQDERYYRLMDRSADARQIYRTDLFSGSEDAMERFRGIFYGSNAASFLNRMFYFDLKVHLPALLHVEDRTSMAWGLESRVPLLDHRIAELVASIPPAIKFKGGQPKYLFRKAIKSVIPPAIFNRKDKMGFPVPLHLWFRDSVGQFTREVLLDRAATQRGIFDSANLEAAINQEKSFSRIVWGALCIELWFKTFIDA